MKFDLTAPCGECPFRSDRRPYLTVARVRQILTALFREDKTFACHKSTGIVNGKHVRRVDHQMCAGAAILVKKGGWRNAMLQIAERLGLMDSRELKMDAPVWRSAWAFLRAQAIEDAGLTRREHSYYHRAQETNT